MKLRFSKQRNRAWTLIDIAVVIAVMVVLGALLLPVLEAAKKRSARNDCLSNVKQVGLAFRIWEEDHNNEYPMGISVTNGGARELIATGNVASCFQVMSNELMTPKILVCPNDAGRMFATNFENDFNDSHISYFLSVDATNERNPAILLSGDDNLAIGDKILGLSRPVGFMGVPGDADIPLKSGMWGISTNIPVSWQTDVRHLLMNNVAFADGSVMELSESGLIRAFEQTGLATNHLAIP